MADASLLVVPTGENPCQAEQFGKAAVEGVTLGLPVLASRTGNLAELAKEFPTLAALELGTAAQLAEAVAGIFAAYPDATARAKGRDLALDAYGAGAAARRLESAFAQVLGGAEAGTNGKSPGMPDGARA